MAAQIMLVLIVDDNPRVRRLLRMAIEEEQCEVLEAQDGAEGLQSYSDSRPDLVLMDVNMPRLDGLAAARALLHVDSQAKIVIVTDYDQQEMRLAAIAAGACGFVSKHDLTGLAALVRTTMHAARTS